jgi:xanthine dehydrogenase YagR molybdenum-binding subunit
VTVTRPRPRAAPALRPAQGRLSSWRRRSRTRVIGYATADERSPLFNLKAADISVRNGRVSSATEITMSYGALRRYGKMVNQGLRRTRQERGPQPVGSAEPESGYRPLSMLGRSSARCASTRTESCKSRWVGSFAPANNNVKTPAASCKTASFGASAWPSGEALLDARFGRYVNSNLAEYHVPVNADIPYIEIVMIVRGRLEADRPKAPETG